VLSSFIKDVKNNSLPQVSWIVAPAGWPTDQDGYYDVVISTNTGDGFRRRYAGRIA
jgi:hypothetical protein